jgi:type IV pilus assembly protein PilY1
MKNLKLILTKVFLFSLIIISNSYGKALPPGSGVADVPANVLILLDKSGSMSVTSTTGAKVNRTYSITAISNTGNVIVSDDSTLRGVDHDNNSLTNFVGSNNSYRKRHSTCSTYFKTKYGILYHNNKVYFTGAYNRNSGNYLYELNTTTGTCQSLEFFGNWKQVYGRLLVSNDILIFPHISSGRYRIYLRDTNSSSEMTCNPSGQLFSSMRYGYMWTRMPAAIDASGNLVIKSYEGGKVIFRRFALSGSTACPSNTANATYTFNNDYDLRYSNYIEAHPTNDNIFYSTNYNSHRLIKTTFTSTTTFTKSTVGRYGSVSATYAPTSASQVRFNQPQDLRIDTALNRIFVADTNNNAIQSFDLDLNFHDLSGYSTRMSRMAGAQQAIQSIVTDSSLVSSVNFGFGYWSSGTSIRYSRWRNWRTPVRCSTLVARGLLSSSSWLVRYNYWCSDWLVSYGYTRWGNMQAVPCTSQNCLRVRVDRDGARLTNRYVRSVRPGGGTDANIWATIAEQYYNHSDSPIDSNSPCQGSYVIVIGDGIMGNVSQAETKVSNLLMQRNLKTFTVAYGGGISSSGIRAFNNIARAGGTERVIVADTTDQLKAQLNAAIRSVIAEKLSFTAPAITATIEEGGSLFQAQFKYKQNMEWEGALTRTVISAEGVINEKDTTNWNASEKMPEPKDRKIWGAIPGTDYTTDYNNFTETNSILIDSMFTVLNNSIGDYHKDTPTVSGVTGNTRCSARGDSTSTIADGVDDDIKGLISFVRGLDYFDYDGDCNLNENRMSDGKKAYLGDIFHSEMVVVGAPSADTAYSSMNQEAYYRSINNYDTWAKSLHDRAERIYVGGNDGMLHAIDSKTGVEKWAFIPPFIMGKLPLVINTGLNTTVPTNKGGTNSIYGVDGSPVVHDMYFKSPYDTAKAWHTILFVPFGRGGNGFTVLDVTNAKDTGDKPLHLYTIYNDHIKNKVMIMNHLNVLSEYEYIDDTYSLAEMEEGQTALDNYNTAVDKDAVDLDICDATGNTTCYESRTWTFPEPGLSKSDLTITLNNVNIPNFAIGSGTAGTEIIFPTTVGYQAHQDRTKTSDEVEIKLSRSAIASLSSNFPPEYDYRELGETWSAPRIFRLPNNGAGDNAIDDDIYVAVMGGGYGGRDDNVGSGLFVINLEDQIKPGKIEKYIEIENSNNLDIVNSVPGTPVVITADQARGIKFKGALVYVNDFEGKITKFNLTNMENDGAGNLINLYDNTTLLQIEASRNNGRYQYHSMDAGIGKTTKQLWLYSGTGDYERMTERSSSIDNLMYGFRDKDYPLYRKKINAATLSDGLRWCMDTTGDTTGAKCPVTTNSGSSNTPTPKPSTPGGWSLNLMAAGSAASLGFKQKDNGWYIKLPDSQKVTAEPTVHGGLVYFPIFEPSQSANRCSLGLALICAVDDECGTNVSSQLGNLSSQTIEGKVYAGKTCYAVGEGVLSRLVIFANKLFANIAGKSVQDKTDLVVIDTGMGDIESFRSSWREGNF